MWPALYVEVGSMFESNQTGRKLQIRHFFNCKLTLVVYRACCQCGAEYVGKTTRQLQRRIGEHLGDICHGRDTVLARHIKSCQNDNPKHLRFMAIDCIKPDGRRGNWDRLLLQRETYWIFTLKTMIPNGINEQLLFTPFL